MPAVLTALPRARKNGWCWLLLLVLLVLLLFVSPLLVLLVTLWLLPLSDFASAFASAAAAAASSAAASADASSVAAAAVAASAYYAALVGSYRRRYAGLPAFPRPCPCLPAWLPACLACLLRPCMPLHLPG